MTAYPAMSGAWGRVTSRLESLQDQRAGRAAKALDDMFVDDVKPAWLSNA